VRRVLQPGWRWARLGDCCEIVSGATPRTEVREYWDGDILWATPRDLSVLKDRVLHETAKRITRKGYESCSTSLLPPGAVLFTSRAPVGLVAIVGQPMCTNQGFKSLVPGADVDSGYLFWCLRSSARAIERRGSGTTFTEVSKEVVSRFEIPLPMLTEQKRIATLLDKADELQRKRQESLRLFDEFLHSAFRKMFGDPVKNEKGWDIRTVGELCEVQLGKMLSDKARGGANPVPYLRNANVQWRKITLNSLLEMNFSDAELAKFNLRSGDLLVCEGGEVGRCAIWEGDLARCSFQKALHRVRPRDHRVRTEYLQELLYFLARAGALAGSTSQATIAHLTKEQLQQLAVPVPPAEIQGQFGRLYRSVGNAQRLQQARFESVGRLIESLGKQAFENRLPSPESNLRGQT
jgi:type I restriction enzyme S subunit